MENKLCESGLLSMKWDYKITHARKNLGTTDTITWAPEKYILVSRFHILNHSDIEVVDTILHEIAHALDIELRGYTNHDDTWKLIAEKVGAMPIEKANIPIHRRGFRWKVFCKACDEYRLLYSKPRKRLCFECNNTSNNLLIKKL